MKTSLRDAYPAAWAICPTRFLLGFAQGGLLSPLLPLLRETFDVSYGELGLLTSAFGLSAVGMDLIATGFLSRRPLLQVLLQGIVVTGVGLLGCALAPSFYWMVAARALLGFGVSMVRFALLTVLVTATPRSAQGRAHNLLEFSAIAGHTVSPTLSGLLAVLVHWRAAYGAALVFVVAAFAWVVYTRDALAKAMQIAATQQVPHREPHAAPAVSVPSWGDGSAMFIAYVAAFVLSFIWGGFVSTALPLYGGDVVGLSTSTLGLIMTAGLVVDLVLLLPTGWLSDRLQHRIVLAPALGVLVISLLGLPHVSQHWGLLLVSLGLHAGFAAWGMPSAALAMLTHGHRLTRAMAWYRLLVDGAAVIAPWLMGLLIERYGYGGPSLYTAFGVALTTLCVAWGMRPVRPEVAAHPV